MKLEDKMILREENREGFLISTDKSKLNVDLIYNFLSQSYWACDRKKSKIIQSIENSLCFGVYKGNEQIGFARLTTDYTLFAYLADLFIIEEFRGKGLSKWLMEFMMNIPELEEVGNWMLKTKDAHGLYRQFEFEIIKNPEIIMERKIKK